MPIPHNVRYFLSAVVIAGLTLVLAGSAQATSFGKPGSSKVGVEHMALMKGASGSFSDKYTVEAKLEGGGEFYFSIHHRSFGVGGASFEVKSRYRAPGGETYRTSQKLGGSDWSQASGAKLELQMGDHKLEGTPERWTISGKGEDMGFSLTFTPSAPPWRPGKGRAKFGGTDDFVDMTVLAPRADVTGTITVDGEERSVEGTGYALHSFSNMAPHETARRMVGFRTESGALSFYFKEIMPADKWGSTPIRWLLVARKGEILFESTDFAIEGDDVWIDEAHENRYPVPMVLKLQAQDGDDTFSAALKVVKRRERSDRLAKLSGAKKVVAAKFAKPVYYAYVAAYKARVTRGGKKLEFSGKGIYEVDHINK